MSIHAPRKARFAKAETYPKPTTPDTPRPVPRGHVDVSTTLMDPMTMAYGYRPVKLSQGKK